MLFKSYEIYYNERQAQLKERHKEKIFKFNKVTYISKNIILFNYCLLLYLLNYFIYEDRMRTFLKL